MSRIEGLTVEQIDYQGLVGFEIRSSRAEQGAMTLVSPDIATCPDCLSELASPGDRRHRYPFINCTNCGPRFTIIADVPYDRPMTTMRDFPMCPECSSEYGDPSDRRFHAQPDACFVCGPRLYLNLCEGAVPGGAVLKQASAASPPAELRAAPPGTAPSSVKTESDHLPADWGWTPERESVPRPHRDRDTEAARSDEIVATAAALLLDSRILAVKGLGGFHLACNALDSEAVATLRQRKHRWGKPLAVMMRDLDEVRKYCEVNDQEADLLSGPVRPVVLLRRKASSEGGVGIGLTPGTTVPGSASCSGTTPGGAARSSAGAEGDEDCLSTAPPGVVPPLANGIADGLAEIGVMLPYTPLHHLLLDAVGAPLVMTSGNLSDEPIATGNAEAIERLGTIADAFLLHDREIYSRYDDSVVRVVRGIVEPVRRARGYAPHPIKLPFSADTAILAAGPEQKNTFTLLTGEYAFVSQHIGDLENAETLASYQSTLDLYQRLFRIEPHLIAHDDHPEYLSTKWALEQNLPKVSVQHHHAHIASVTAEHGIAEKVVGIAFDGTGYGSDGRIWGGEVLACDWQQFERVAHLRYVPMPGGSGAIKRPARMALGVLSEYGLLDHPGAGALRSRLAPGEENTLLTMIARGVNCPLTSSMGRLFDAVSSIIGIADDAHYEGEAAILLEAAAEPQAEGSYRFELIESELLESPLIIDAGSLLAAVLSDVDASIPSGVISMRFHRAVVACVVAVSEVVATRLGTRKVALAGGVFMNRLVLGGSVEALKAAGLEPLTHVNLPVNDGAVSFGQAVVAWARRHQA
ncbi:MAG: hydrogenase maturation protein HypF [Actinobacteria bacterium HGW-Actinobacteria-7]|nr:MAG: hydrogenase maturation protein HypF [Actinobacteria bacterium HGW-Actinobacteria-7]